MWTNYMETTKHFKRERGGGGGGGGRKNKITCEESVFVLYSSVFALSDKISEGMTYGIIMTQRLLSWRHFAVCDVSAVANE